MLKLIVAREGSEAQVFDLGPESTGKVLLGRAESAQVRLEGHSVGREHAEIVWSDGVMIRRKTKFGKLAVNGRDVMEANFAPGDFAVIGDYRIELSDDVSEGMNAGAAPISSSDAAGPALDFPASPEASLEAAPAAELEAGGEPESARASSTVELPADNMDSVLVSLDGGNPTSAVEASSGTSETNTMPPPSGQTAPMEMDLSGVSTEEAPSEAGSEDKTSIISKGEVLATLSLTPGSANVETFEIKKGEIAIGRGANCDVVLNDPKSSRKHMLVRRVGAKFFAVDLGSANGTYLNGARFTESELSGGDKLRIGDTEFAFNAVSQAYKKQEEAGFMSVAQTDPGFARPASEFNKASQTQEIPIFGRQRAAEASRIFASTQLLNDLSKSKKRSLLTRFREQPTVRKALIVGLILAGLGVFNDEEVLKSVQQQGKSVITKTGDPSFDGLQPEKKQFVVNTYQLAFDLYKQREYEKALYEVTKLLQVLPSGYKDSKDIKVYAEKAIDQLKAAADEKKRKEDEERIRNEVAVLAGHAQELVDEEKYDEAKDVFSKILERDPENPTVIRLQQMIEEKLTQRRIAEESRKDKEARKKNLQNLLAQGKSLLEKERYYEAIDLMKKAPETGYYDERMQAEAKGISDDARRLLLEKTQPLLAEGRSAFQTEDYTRARDAYLKALKIDYKSVEAKRGLDQIREILHMRAKQIYIDGLVAESVSDYKSAKQKFGECLAQAMPEDVYFGRCTRKTKKYQLIDRGVASDAASAPAAREEGANDGNGY